MQILVHIAAVFDQGHEGCAMQVLSLYLFSARPPPSPSSHSSRHLQAPIRKVSLMLGIGTVDVGRALVSMFRCIEIDILNYASYYCYRCPMSCTHGGFTRPLPPLNKRQDSPAHTSHQRQLVGGDV